MNGTLFLSGSEPEIISKLHNLGYRTVICNPNAALEGSISGHADCALFTPDGNTFFAAESDYNSIVNFFTKGESKDRFNKKVIKIKDIKSPYPSDVKLNAKAFGRKILCNTSYISGEIKVFSENNGFKLIYCNQGYAACSTVKLSDNAAITDDESVYGTLTANGIDCIIVSKGSVKLKGFSYGFIGGCCGMIENNLLAFAGSLEKHKDYEMIKSFLRKHGIDYINLIDGDLIDIGGIITL